jgi:energy-coupling factor transporter ATP-binding protein EcfA2
VSLDRLLPVRLTAAGRSPAPLCWPSPSPAIAWAFLVKLRRPTAEGSPLEQLATHPQETLAGWLRLAAHAVLGHLPLLSALAVTGGVLAVVGRVLVVRWRHTRLADGASMVQVQVPPQVEPPAAAALWANVIGLLRPRWRRIVYGQPHVAFEYCWDGPELRIQLWIPAGVPAAMIARAIEAAWPAARTTITSPSALICEGSAVTGGTLRLARPDHYPIATDHSFGQVDPIRALLGAASGLSGGQLAVVQVLARPATGRRLAKAHRAAAILRGAHQPTLLGRLLDLATPGVSSRPTRPAGVAAAHPERAADIRAILDKAATPRFEVVVRYAAATTHLADEHAARAVVRGRAHALASAFAVLAGRNHFDRHRLRHPTAVINARWMGRGDLLSLGELAAIAHLPYDPAVPGLTRAGANAVPPPPAVPTGGPNTKPLGVADAGALRQVALRVPDSRQHLHVIGATGSGKSTLLAQMVLADAAAGRSAVVIDPRGDLTGDILARLPERTASRVWLIDPDTTPPPALNVLSGSDANLVSDNLVGIVHRIFADSWGPRTDDILRSAVLTLQQVPGATLADIPRLLTDEPYRTRATRRIAGPGGDDILAGFWTWYSSLSPEARANATGPVMNKLRHFLLRPFVRQIVGAPGGGLNMGHLLDSGAIVLVRLPRGTLGEDTARLLGSIVLAKVWESITARARTKEAARRDAGLYIDEAHAFLNLPHGLEEMLAEARAYRLAVTLAHQNLTQFPPGMRDAVAANARNKIFFAVSPQDARDLAHATWPNLTAHDLSNLGAYQAAARLIVSSQETPAFTLTTRPLPDEIPGRAELLRHAARKHAASTRTPATLPDPRLDDPIDMPPEDLGEDLGSDGPPAAYPPT